MLTSYAQNFEDVILWRALKHVEKGLYIDVGAQDPVVDSVSLAFYQRGWRGVHVEPTSAYAQKLREARPDETVIQAAAGMKEGHIPFWEFPGTGLSTGDPAVAARHEGDNRECVRVEVPCVPLAQILDAQGDRPIHWLKIDVEGMEQDVIESWSPSPARPWIVVVESTKPLSEEPNHSTWDAKLLARGYEFVYFDGLNRYYVSNDQPQLRTVFGPGPNVFDAFQLGSTSVFVREINTGLGREIERRTAEVEMLRRKVGADAGRDRDIQRLSEQREIELKIANELLSAMRSSTSWRLSAPMRWLGRSARGALRPALERAFRTIQQYPSLKPVVRKVASLAPPIERRLVRFAAIARSADAVRPVVANYAANHSGAIGTPRPLSLRARQILADLDAC